MLELAEHPEQHLRAAEVVRHPVRGLPRREVARHDRRPDPRVPRREEQAHRGAVGEPDHADAARVDERVVARAGRARTRDRAGCRRAGSGPRPPRRRGSRRRGSGPTAPDRPARRSSGGRARARGTPPRRAGGRSRRGARRPRPRPPACRARRPRPCPDRGRGSRAPPDPARGARSGTSRYAGTLIVASVSKTTRWRRVGAARLAIGAPRPRAAPAAGGAPSRSVSRPRVRARQPGTMPGSVGHRLGRLHRRELELDLRPRREVPRRCGCRDPVVVRRRGRRCRRRRAPPASIGHSASSGRGERPRQAAVQVTKVRRTLPRGGEMTERGREHPARALPEAPRDRVAERRAGRRRARSRSSWSAGTRSSTSASGRRSRNWYTSSCQRQAAPRCAVAGWSGHDDLEVHRLGPRVTVEAGADELRRTPASRSRRRRRNGSPAPRARRRGPGRRSSRAARRSTASRRW